MSGARTSKEPRLTEPHSHRSGLLAGALAAVLFGLTAPVLKRLLPEASPWSLAAILYLGSGVGLSLAALARSNATPRARLRRSDAQPLAGVVLFGGVLGPWLMLLGLERVSGATGALLLNLEAPLTILLAVAFFGEHLSRREGIAAAVIVLGAALLTVPRGEWSGSWVGVLALPAACLCWGLDNNLTQRLSLRDPMRLVQVKALAAGSCSLAIAFASGSSFPGPKVIAGTALVGALGYGASVVLDVIALRQLGAAREAAIFSTAPFVGALAAVPILGERLGGAQLGAGAVIALGVVLLVRSRHGHAHTHESLTHEHLHAHDEHHQHPHPEGVDASGPHVHAHTHAAITHDHPHVSDVHHRHRHEG